MRDARISLRSIRATVSTRTSTRVARLRPDDKGILPDRMIAALVKTGAIIPAAALDDDQIQPASLDLRLGEIAYRVRASFLPGPDATVARAHRRTQAARDPARRRRRAGDRLRLHRAADGKPGAAGRHRGRRQSEKLDRPPRRVHPRDRRPDPRLRPHRGRAITARSMPRSARAPSRCWCARARACRRSGFRHGHAVLGGRGARGAARARAPGRHRGARSLRRRSGRRRPRRASAPTSSSATAPSAIPA